MVEEENELEESGSWLNENPKMRTIWILYTKRNKFPLWIRCELGTVNSNISSIGSW